MNLTENQQNCPYCHGMKDLLPITSSSYDHLAILENSQGYVENYYNEDGSLDWYIRINYCPKCGRPLGED